MDVDACRVCFKNNSDELRSMDDYVNRQKATFFQMYEDILHVPPIESGSNLICTDCSETLKVSYEFKKKVSENEKWFEELLRKNQRSNSFTEDICEDTPVPETILIENFIKEEPIEEEDQVNLEEGELPVLTSQKIKKRTQPNDRLGQFVEDDIIACPLCPYKNPKKDNYAKHVERVHNRQKLQCDGCSESHHLIYVLEKHRREQHYFTHEYEVDESLKTGYVPKCERMLFELKEIACVLCDYKTGSKPNYQKHVERVHHRQKMQCDGCEENFHLIYLLEEHRKYKHKFTHPYEVDESLKIVKVGKIGNRTNSRNKKSEKEKSNVKIEEYEETVSRTHAENPNDCKKENNEWDCPDCNQKFLKQNLLDKHRRQVHKHFSENAELCSFCGELYLKSTIKAHIDKVHFNKVQQFICDICGKTTKSKANIQYHMETKHMSVQARKEISKLFQCNYCDETFKYTISLKAHETRYHTFDFPFSCNYCNRKFVFKRELKIHLASHTGEKNFRCEICGMSFSVRSRLNQHMYVHTDERPFHCELCGAAFKTKKGRRVHKHIRHAPEKNYECPVCFKEFKVNLLLRTHLTNHHPEYEAPPLGTVMNKSALLKMDMIAEKYQLENVHVNAKGYGSLETKL